MNKVKMTIHQALATLKTLDSRVLSSIRGSQFINTKKQSSSKIDGIDYNKYTETMRANMQKIKQLIANRHNLRSAIVQSNAINTITIGPVTYTVADAIERKNNINLEHTLLSQLKAQYKNSVNKMNIENEALNEKLERYLASILGASKEGRNTDDVKQLSDQYLKANTIELVDPNSLSSFIDEFEKEIVEFEANVDFKLSESNATTYIEVEYINV